MQIDECADSPILVELGLALPKSVALTVVHVHVNRTSGGANSIRESHTLINGNHWVSAAVHDQYRRVRQLPSQIDGRAIMHCGRRRLVGHRPDERVVVVTLETVAALTKIGNVANRVTRHDRGNEPWPGSSGTQGGESSARRGIVADDSGCLGRNGGYR